MPSQKDKTSVLVPCCTAQDNVSESGLRTDESTEGSLQHEPLTHLQGTGADIPAKEAGASVESRADEAEGKKGLRGLARLMPWRGKEEPKE